MTASVIEGAALCTYAACDAAAIVHRDAVARLVIEYRPAMQPSIEAHWWRDTDRLLSWLGPAALRDLLRLAEGPVRGLVVGEARQAAERN